MARKILLNPSQGESVFKYVANQYSAEPSSSSHHAYSDVLLPKIHKDTRNSGHNIGDIVSNTVVTMHRVRWVLTY